MKIIEKSEYEFILTGEQVDALLRRLDTATASPVQDTDQLYLFIRSLNDKRHVLAKDRVERWSL